MSARKLGVRFSREADQDMADISLYTRLNWGERQQLSYEDAILRVLDMLARHPRAGRARDDLFPGCRDISVKQHVIFYHQLETNEIEIVRVLHRRQDASSAVTPPT
jgi:toxin ParE1/3/4